MNPVNPMTPIDPLLYFWLFLKASLLSTGGLGNLPFLHQDLIALGWATEADFVVAIAVGQVSPGPNGLWTISLGYLTYGWLGAGLALIAITLPTLLALVIVALHRRVETHPLVQRFTLGITLGVIGLTLGVAWTLFCTTVTDWRGVMITLGALALALTKRVPIVLVLALAALAGWLLYGAPL
jgi:chromate transporter